MRIHFTFALMALLSACSMATPPSTPMPDPSSQLTGHDWQLQSAESASGQPLKALQPADHPPLVLRFRDHRLHLLHACNAIAGRYTVKDGVLRIDAMLHTMMACADPALNRLEHAAMVALQGPVRLSLVATAAGPRLDLVNAGGDTLRFIAIPPEDAARPSR